MRSPYGGAAARVDGGPVERELHEVACSTSAGLRERDNQNRSRIARVADADVAECVDHAFVGEDAVGGDEPRELARHVALGAHEARHAERHERGRAAEHAAARAARH